MLNENNIVNSIVFIDPTVPDYKSLMAGVAPGTEVVALNSKSSGVAQITEVLAQRSNISSLHIVSHGASGSLQSGTEQLTLEDLNPQRENWGNGQTPSLKMPISFYMVATSHLGRWEQTSWEELSQLTGADVAASDDLTGSAALGGNWISEDRSGSN